MTRSKKTEDIILEKLDTLIKLLGHQVAASHETIETKAVVLSSLGLQSADIAKICGTTPGTISVRLAEAKKKGNRKVKGKK
jgi:DNA-directed RNA polymerase specialized sigma24 family protein